MKKKLISLLLVVMMVLSIFTPVLAMDVEEQDIADDTTTESAPAPEEDEGENNEDDTDSPDVDEGGEDKSDGDGESVDDVKESDDENEEESERNDEGTEDAPDDEDGADVESDDENEEDTYLVEQSLSATVVGYNVEVSGLLPEGIELEAKQVGISRAERMVDITDGYEIVFAVDITLYLDGAKYEIPETVTVTIENLVIPADNIVETFHVSDAGKVDVLDTAKSGDCVSFDTDSFSTFIITAAAADALELFEIVYFVDGESVSTKEIGLAEGEAFTFDDYYLAAPENMPANMNTFLGWYAEDAAEDAEPFKSEDILQQSDFTDGKYELYARFDPRFLVSFWDADGKVISSQLVTDGELCSDSDVTVTAPQDFIFSHWYTDDEDIPFDFKTPVSSQLILKPAFINGFYAVFISEGTQVEPQFIKTGEKITKPSDPTREGFQFKHWAVEGEDTEYSFDEPVTKNTVLQAVWTPKNMRFQIVFWLEKPNLGLADPDPGDADKYNYAFTTTGSGAAGTMTNVQPAIPPTVKNNHFGLKHSRVQKVENSIILGNGTTVVNIYCARNVYEYKFNLNARATIQFDGSETVYTQNNPSISNISYSFKAKYEQDIEALWPSTANAEIKRYNENTSTLTHWIGASNTSGSGQKYLTKRFTVTSDMVPAVTNPVDGAEITYTAAWGQLVKRKANYWFEVLPEDEFLSGGQLKDGYKSYGGSVYRLSEEYTQDIFQQSTESLTNKVIEGMTSYTTVQRGPSQQLDGDDFRTYNRIYDLYYQRNRHRLTFNAAGGKFSNGASVLNTKPAMYGESLNKVEYLLDPRIEGLTRIEDGVTYIFDGWYLDAKYDVPIDPESMTMPDNDVVLYAKWLAGDYTVEFYDDLDAEAPIENSSVGIIKNKYLLQEETPYKPGQTVDGKGQFIGWYYFPIKGAAPVPFSYDTPISRDWKLYAQWKTDGYKVTYNANGGTGTVPVDGNKSYNSGELHQLMSGQGLRKTIPNQTLQIFIGWSDKTGGGKILHPSSIYAIEKDSTFYAQYGRADEYVQLTYVPNFAGSQDSPVFWTVKKNSKIEELAGQIFQRPGYRLIGWNTKVDYTGDFYYPESDEYTMGDRPATLYAVWEMAIGNLEIKKEFGNKLNPGLTEIDFIITSDDYGYEEQVTVSANEGWTNTIYNLLEGEYTITEVKEDGTTNTAKVPGYSLEVTGEGAVYVSDGKNEVTVTNTYTKNSVEENIPATLTVKKTATGEYDNAPLQGAQFKLVDLNSKAVFSSITDKDGIAEFTGVFEGTYSLYEALEPTGYDKIETEIAGITISSEMIQNGEFVDEHKDYPNGAFVTIYEHTVSEILILDNDYAENADGTIIVQNIRKGEEEIEKLAGFEILKVNEKNRPLDTATFQLYKDTEPYGDPVSTVGGRVSFTNLGEGRYTIEEVSAPRGYQALEGTLATIDVVLEDGKASIQWNEDTELWNKISNWIIGEKSNSPSVKFDDSGDVLVVEVKNVPIPTRPNPDPDPTPTPTPDPDPSPDPDIDDPDPPTNPGDPDNPASPEESPTDIGDPDTPTDPGPPIATIPEPEIPLNPGPPPGAGDLIDIDDGEIPLASAPRTKDDKKVGGLWAMLAASALSAAFLVLSGKKKELENDEE